LKGKENIFQERGLGLNVGQEERKSQNVSKVRQYLVGDLQNRANIRAILFLLIHDIRKENATTGEWISPQTLLQR
jgi:hypothetical protein